jgi:hypothetical protein
MYVTSGAGGPIWPLPFEDEKMIEPRGWAGRFKRMVSAHLDLQSCALAVLAPKDALVNRSAYLCGRYNDVQAALNLKAQADEILTFLGAQKVPKF